MSEVSFQYQEYYTDLIEIAKTHRANLIERLQLKPEDGILVAGKPPTYRNKDVEYVFRQESDFMYYFMFLLIDSYLTGMIEEPGVAVLITTDKYVVFIMNNDARKVIYDGFVIDPAYFAEKYGVTHVDGLHEINKAIDTVTDAEEFVMGESDFNVDSDAYLDALYELRSVKDAKEIEIMKKVAKVSCNAHIEVMKQSKPGMNEMQLDSTFRHYCAWHGCKHQAYVPIVAGNNNGATLHYVKNNMPIADNTFVLIDAGCEYAGYASDITRTFPVNGKFTEQQKKLYSAVLNVQKKVIELVKPGIEWDFLSLECEKYIIEALLELKFIQGNVQDLIDDCAHKAFMPHGLGHHFGLDVHDTTIFPETLEPGFMITIEPGIYFQELLLTNPDAEGYVLLENVKPYIHLGGVRIEDNILVTETGYENLTQNAPKEIEDIERIMQGN